MPFAPFHELCPDVAQRETRTLSVMPAATLGPPVGDYQFIEMFCNEPNCDCRRVFFSVFSERTGEIEAVIAWGWEDQAFYQRWLGDDDPDLASQMQGPTLNLASEHSHDATALLELARRVLLVDPDYVARIKRHYALFRSKVDGRVKKNRKNLRKKPGRKFQK
jgi:hypothetical protein